MNYSELDRLFSLLERIATALENIADINYRECSHEQVFGEEEK